MNYTESIDIGLAENRPHSEIVRKVYLTLPTMAMVGDEERQFSILNKISLYFDIPIVNIQVVGSAKTGQSFHKVNKFTRKISDLDVAIIDSNLFQKYSEYVFKQTKGFKDRTTFPIVDGRSTYNEYVSYISKGIFRPDLMPTGKKRANWRKFFGKLSGEHKDLFKSINAGIYMSQAFFELKQSSIIKDYISNKTV